MIASIQALMLTPIVFAILYGSLIGQRPSLRISSHPDPTHTDRNSHLYVAQFRNSTSQKIRLEAVQLPGGYVGSGRFFPCELETWDRQRKRWEQIKETRLFQFGHPRIVTVIVAPHTGIDVCRALLPHEGGRPGMTIRFRLWPRWMHGRKDFYVSDAVEVGR